MVIIKKEPSDFKVREIINIELSPGNYSYYKLVKRNYDTLKAIEGISQKTKIHIKRFGWAGNKDKHAETEQTISIVKAPKSKLKELKLKT